MAFAARPLIPPLRSLNPSVPKSLPLTTVKIKPFSCAPRSANPSVPKSRPLTTVKIKPFSFDDGDNSDNIGGGGLGKGGGGSGGHDGNSSSGCGGSGGNDGNSSSGGGGSGGNDGNSSSGCVGSGGNDGNSSSGGGGSGGHDGNSSSGGGGGGLSPLGDFRVKVLMEELAAGDMATRPNFSLDSTLSALVISSLVGVALMCLVPPTLAPTSSSTSLPSYIFGPGPFPPSARLATLFYKGLIFGAVGFASGLAGAAVWNGLVAMRRRKEDKDAKEEKKKGPKTVLNAALNAVHVGVSSYLMAKAMLVGYQTLNAVEFLMAKAMLVGVFKGTVVVLRCLINVAGGFASGLAGTVRKKEKDAEEKKKKKKKGPKTVLNVATWAVHMGVSSYFKNQSLDAVVEFLMAKAMPVGVFKATAVVVNAGWCVQG